MSARDLKTLYQSALLQDVLPFWQRHSLDRQHGGYFTCLDRRGKVYDTDKFMWLQGRQAWMFAALYNRLERRQEWLDIAALGIDFMREHGRDAEGHWYFALDREGGALVQPYNIYSDCFAAMAFSQYALATGNGEAKDIARQTFLNILRRRKNPKGRFSKAGVAARPMNALGIPMILSHMSFELEHLLTPAELELIYDLSVETVLGTNLDRERMLIFEAVAPDGSHPDCFDGRLISPGHGIEAMWFMMDIAERRGDRAMIDLTVDVVLSQLEFGWDNEHAGIFYFRDSEGAPPDRLDWDQKLWWVHLETLIALLKGYRLTGRRECWQWFEKVHEYTWGHFPDPNYGEWFGYLTRRGEVLLDCKGGKWKGCFHVPRALWICWQELERIG